jgi:hypothetical protein
VTRSAFLVAVLLPALGFPPSIGGQSVRVTVVQRASREPVSGVIALLIGTDGKRLVATLTDERGQATLEAQAGRRVRVLVESIGFVTSRSDEFELGADTKELEVALETRRLVLPTVAVRDRRRCETGPTSEASVAVWEEVRKALTATTLAPAAPQLAVWHYIRRLDRSHRIIAETTSTRSVVGTAFASASARQLIGKGFAQEQGGAAFYFAPDAELLLAPSFVQTYCFGVRSADGTRRLVGLTFEPQSGRTTPDIEGTLWLDAESGDLRWMDFTYTRLPQSVGNVSPEGRVEFERLPNGAWVVQRWYIRLPVIARAQGARVGRFTTPPTDTVIGFREEGGWLTRSVVNPDASSMMELSGVVFDSLLQKPLTDVRIVLGGGVAEARTDQQGRYRLKHFMPGRYVVTAEHPRLAAFGSDRSEREAILTTGRTTTANWAVAGASVIRERLCPSARDEGGEQRVIIAQVVDANTGFPITGARTSASWSVARVQAVGGMVLSVAGDSVAESRTDHNGFATFCMSRQIRQLTLHAEDEGRQAVRGVSVSDTAVIAEVHLPLSPTPGRGLRFRARVIVRSSPDTSFAAEIMIPARGQSYYTDRNGRADVGGLGAGPLAVVVRSPGYQPLFTRVVLPQADDSVQTFVLHPLPQALQTVVVTGTRSEGFREFEERRAVHAGGTYLSREDLASREGAKLSDVLRTVRGVRILRRPDGALVLASARGAFSRSIKDCPYQIVLDGQRLYALGSGGPEGSTPPSIDEFAPAGLEAIEVYTGPATTPPQFGGLGAACGTIVLWTRR